MANDCLEKKELNFASDDMELAEKVSLKQSSEISSSLGSDEKKSCEIKQKKPALGNSSIKVIIFPALLCSSFYQRYKSYVHGIFFSLLIFLYSCYFIWALVYDSNGAIPLVILSATVVAIVLFELCMLYYGSRLKSSFKTLGSKECRKKLSKAILILGILFAIGFTLWLVIDVVMRNPRQLLSLFGFFIILLVCIWGSKFPQHINWRPVVWGIALQFILGVIVLRSKVGFTVIKFIGDEIARFMNYSESGAKFVFGNDFRMHLFAFKVLPMIVFFSMFTNMMFYLGLMQWFIGKLSFLTQKTLGTSAIESTVAAANIFVGMTEAPLVVRPYLPKLTKAEIHSVLTAGLGSIAFSVFGVFVEMKVSGVHLLTACVMSAPASLVVSRMLYPEKEKSKFTTTDSLELTAGTERNIVEAAAVGASSSISLVANIAANLIAFLGLLAFVNSSLTWFGAFVGIQELTFDVICGYVFMPIAFLLGADWEDCWVVGKLFGIKTFLNEFVAYQDMQPYIENRLNVTVPKYDTNGNVLRISERSEVIAIHALCGFCNFSSLGIIIGGLSVLMPTRRSDVVELAVRALIGGMLTCCMTASIAGFLFIESSLEMSTAVNTTDVMSLASASYATFTDMTTSLST